MTYWRFQALFDVSAAIFLVVFGNILPIFGFPIVLETSVDDIDAVSRAWLGPLLTLVGMMSATTAFIFTVVDKSEFKMIQAKGVEHQLFFIFSENIFWITSACIFCALSSFFVGYDREIYFLASFIFCMVCICLLKFSWVMRQVIGVRIAQSKRSSQP